MCTRAVYLGSDNTVITGRSLDWNEDMYSNLYAFPRGLPREGAAGPASVRWTSKYGSLIVSAYEMGTADGMNEEGLVGNGLYLAESEYGTPKPGEQTISVMVWLQYVLDNYRNVAEAVTGLRDRPFQVVTLTLPNGRGAQVHASLSDPTGDSAIFEYIDGQLVVHHGRQYQVMTNSPTYDRQLAIKDYWKEIGGMNFLPGTISAADRYARASFLINAIPKQLDTDTISAVPGQTFGNQAVAYVLSVMRAVGVPLGLTVHDKPNLSSTLWRTVHDHKNKVLFFDSATTPNAFWVPLADLNFSEGAPVMKLTVEGGRVYAGNATGQFARAGAFTFQSAA
jgi:penicillin V acylase-like amidase (Ntn superfamily)